MFLQRNKLHIFLQNLFPKIHLNMLDRNWESFPIQIKFTISKGKYLDRGNSYKGGIIKEYTNRGSTSLGGTFRVHQVIAPLTFLPKGENKIVKMIPKEEDELKKSIPIKSYKESKLVTFLLVLGFTRLPWMPKGEIVEKYWHWYQCGITNRNDV